MDIEIRSFSKWKNEGENMKLKKDVKNAIIIGVMCSIAYLAVYIARNILSAVSPQMIESNAFGVDTQKFIGKVSSVYFIAEQ